MELDAPPPEGTLPAVTAIREQLILVDSRDRAAGSAEKLRVHRLGLRHRAFSVFLVDPRGRLLLQQRSAAKYHSPAFGPTPAVGTRVRVSARRRRHGDGFARNWARTSG